SFYERLDAMTDLLARGLREAASESGVPVTVNSTTGMLTVFFTRSPVVSLDQAQSADTPRFARFFHAMLERGVSVPPSQFEAWMISAAHDDEIVHTTVEAARSAFRAISHAA